MQLKENLNVATQKYLPVRPTQAFKGRVLTYFHRRQILRMEILLVTSLAAKYLRNTLREEGFIPTHGLRDMSITEGR